MIAATLSAFLFWALDMSILTIPFVAMAAWLIDTLLLWVFYLAIMHMKHIRDDGRLPEDSVLMATGVLYIGLFQDFSYNVMWATLMFVDYPRDWLVTGRLKKYKHDGVAAWRIKLTNWFARSMLDPFDPSGKHL